MTTNHRTDLTDQTRQTGPRRTAMYGTQHLASEIAGFLDGVKQDFHDEQPTLIAEPDGDQLVVDALLADGSARRFRVHITEVWQLRPVKPTEPAGPPASTELAATTEDGVR